MSVSFRGGSAQVRRQDGAGELAPFAAVMNAWGLEFNGPDSSLYGSGLGMAIADHLAATVFIVQMSMGAKIIFDFQLQGLDQEPERSFA